MDTHRHPVGPARSPSPRARIVLRVLGGVLLLAGLALLVRGGVDFLGQATADPFDPGYEADPGFGPIVMLAGGGFACVFGLGMLNAGFLGAQASYAAGETAPAVRELGDAFRGESVGQSVEQAGDGPFCSACGVRADREARFCDACGHALAPR
jgi:hypothetical protein